MPWLSQYQECKQTCFDFTNSLQAAAWGNIWPGYFPCFLSPTWNFLSPVRWYDSTSFTIYGFKLFSLKIKVEGVDIYICVSLRGYPPSALSVVRLPAPNHFQTGSTNPDFKSAKLFSMKRWKYLGNLGRVKPPYMEHLGTEKMCSLYKGVPYIEVLSKR